jgi:hypothetical protein
VCTENGTFCWRAFSKTCVYTKKIFFLFFVCTLFFVTHVLHKKNFFLCNTKFARVHKKFFCCARNIWCAQKFLICAQKVCTQISCTRKFFVCTDFVHKSFCRIAEIKKFVKCCTRGKSIFHGVHNFTKTFEQHKFYFRHKFFYSRIKLFVQKKIFLLRVIKSFSRKTIF